MANNNNNNNSPGTATEGIGAAGAGAGATAGASPSGTSLNSNNNPREIFETTGDAFAALRTLDDNHRKHHQQTGHRMTLTERYNRVWLSELSSRSRSRSTKQQQQTQPQDNNDDETTTATTTTETTSSFIERVGSAQEAIIDAQPTPGVIERNRTKPVDPYLIQRETFTLTYNHALLLISEGGNYNDELAKQFVTTSSLFLEEELRSLLLSLVGNKDKDKEEAARLPPENAKLGVWMAFAMLESILTKYPFQSSNHNSSNNNGNNNDGGGGDGPQVDWDFLRTLTDFIQDNLDVRKDVAAADDDPQLKFLWSLYKSRLDFFQRDSNNGKLVDSSIRSARKELKTAMEIFQHKLLKEGGTGGVTNESGSLASSTSAGVNGTGTGTGGTGTTDGNNNNNNNHYVQPAMSRDLQAMNRAALNLKANTELLKGNVKKSLILCSEALSSVSEQNPGGDESNNNHNNSNNNSQNDDDDDDDDYKAKAYYDAIHQNNLALVYEASGKSYLALHALSKAITSVEVSGSSLLDRFERTTKQPHNNNTRSSSISSSSVPPPNNNTTVSSNSTTTTTTTAHATCNFDTDGTVRSDVTVPILNNAAICSLRTGNYLAAYQCMSKCIQNSKVWKDRTRSWIHLSEACIGMHTQQKQEQKKDSVPLFSAAASTSVSTGGKPRGLLIGTSSNQNETTTQREDEEMTWTDFTEKDLPKLGTEADLEFIKKFPIVRAKSCLQTALKYFDRMRMSPRDIVAHQSARCSMAYVCMEMKEYATAQKYCEQLILAGYDLVNSHGLSSNTGGVGGDDKKENYDTSKLDEAQLTLIKRLMATARLYASEACSILGDSMSSMTFILGDKKENALDRLAIDLSGVTIEKANGSPKAKTQLAKAQCMVRCNASAAWAVIGNHPVSRQLAMSAQAMENSYSTTRDDSCARKALIYGMLREGNQGAALLTLLRSSASSSIR